MSQVKTERQQKVSSVIQINYSHSNYLKKIKPWPLPSVSTWRIRAKSVRVSHPGALRVAVDHVHGLWACIDRMGQFLFQTVVRLSHLSNAGTQTGISACSLSQNEQHRGPKSSSAAGLLWSYKTKPTLSSSIRWILQHSGVTTQTDQ